MANASCVSPSLDRIARTIDVVGQMDAIAPRIRLALWHKAKHRLLEAPRGRWLATLRIRPFLRTLDKQRRHL